MTDVTIRLSHGLLVIGRPADIPDIMVRAGNQLRLAQVIAALPADRMAIEQLRARLRHIYPSDVLARTSNTELAHQIGQDIRARRLRAAFLPDAMGGAAPAILSSAPLPVAQMSHGDKIAEALLRSRNYLQGEILAAVEELVAPANLAIMAGFIVAVAVAHATGIAGAAIDAVLIGIAWASAGYAGVKAIGQFIDATIRLLDAQSDADLDEAARLYAAAFIALGAAVLARMLAKAKSRNDSGVKVPEAKPAPPPPPPRPAAPAPQRPVTRAAAKQAAAQQAAAAPARPAAPPPQRPMTRAAAKQAAAQQAPPPPPPPPAKATGKKAAKTPNLREQYMGRTPGKKSRTGQEVIERMRGEGSIRDVPRKGTHFKASDGNWYPVKDADMAHTTDAVTWWNQIGRHTGAKSKEVRAFMLDAKNYVLDHFSLNRSSGAKLGHTQTYLPPTKGK